MSGVIKLPDNDDDKPKRHPLAWFKRVSRILLMLLAAILTIYVCILSSERYFMYWVQTTIERTDVHVSEIAFPAITICPTHLSMSNLNGTNKKNREFKRRIRLSNLVNGIQWNPLAGNQTMEKDMKEFEDFSNLSLWNAANILYHAYKCEDLFMECMWRRQVVNCCSIFKRVGFGVTCFIFNSKNANDFEATWPWSVAGSGFNSGLNVKLNRQIGEVRVESVGVIVQEPNQYLGSSVTYSSDDRIVVPLQPIRFTAEAGVKSRPVNMRYCYFSDEVESNGQTRSECIHACHAKYMAKMCNCLYDLPMAVKRFVKDLSPLHVCSVQDLSCIANHKVSFFSMSNIIEESMDNVFNTTDCKCYPDCDHIEYHASIYTDRLGGCLNNKGFIEVDVYFQEETLFSYRSTLYITLLDLMVSFGGIAGLFLGVSVIGFINGILDRIACCGKPSPRPL